jgi:catechol 2,3-dioxygenase-like lactoylglutathione lyase family enzyme
MAGRLVAPLEVGICCSRVERLADFYVELLAAKLVSVIDVPAAKAREASVGHEGYRVARVQLPTGERLKFVEPYKPPQVPAASGMLLDKRNTTYLTFIVDDLKEIMKRLVTVGAEILTGQSPVEIRPGVSTARDPEQNFIEFVRYDDLASYRPALPKRS